MDDGNNKARNEDEMRMILSLVLSPNADSTSWLQLEHNPSFV